MSSLRTDTPVGPGDGIVCSKPDEEKRSCGAADVTLDGCLNLGCCYYETDAAPNCYCKLKHLCCDILWSNSLIYIHVCV